MTSETSGVQVLKGGLDADPAERARIEALAERLERYRASYYAGSPAISDAAYDALEDELRALDPTHAALARVGSAELVSEWEKARHDIPMGSLNKTVGEDELRDWLAQEWRAGEATWTPEARAIFAELGLARGGVSRQLLESERFRALLERGALELPEAA